MTPGTSMHDVGSFLAALQLADSGLPAGRFVHSHGLERWLGGHPDAAEDASAALVASVLLESAAPLDGAALAHAHRAGTLDALLALDAAVTARKLTPASRSASQACGRQLARIGRELVADALADELAEAVRRGATDGNVALVQGVLARALAIPVEPAVVIELRSVAAGLLGAAVRLGRLAPVRAQVRLRELGGDIELAAADALARAPERLRSTSPELEIFAIAHMRDTARFFRT
jgi:urease accessory protein